MYPLANLPKEHQAALQWFIQFAGSEQPWTPTLDNGVRLVTKAKGIFKPSGSEYALSIRQVLGSEYPDKNPIMNSNGSWLYQYYQEGYKPEERDRYYTNRGLLACLRDKIPVGIMRQTSIKPTVRYQVLGIALVTGWDNGYFFFEGFPIPVPGIIQGKHALTEIEILQQETHPLTSNDFNPNNLLDNRERIITSLVRREGQKQFREGLLEAYNNRCAISQWGVVETLEAAHIIPYLGVETNKISNGLLLRADFHILFDIGKIAINTENMTVIICPSILNTEYGQFHGLPLNLPSSHEKLPNKTALDNHRFWASL